MDKHLGGHEYFAGEYSIADMAIYAWCRNPDRRGITHDDSLDLKRWFELVAARPVVQRGEHTPEAWKLLFSEEQYQKR